MRVVSGLFVEIAFRHVVHSRFCRCAAAPTISPRWPNRRSKEYRRRIDTVLLVGLQEDRWSGYTEAKFLKGENDLEISSVHPNTLVICTNHGSAPRLPGAHTGLEFVPSVQAVAF